MGGGEITSGGKPGGDKGGWEDSSDFRYGGGPYGSPDGWAGGGGGGGVAHVRHVSFGSPRLANGNAARYISTMLNNVQTTSQKNQQTSSPELQNRKLQPSQPQSQRQLSQSEQQQLQSQPPEQPQSPSPQSQSSSSPPRLPKEQLPTGVSAPVMRLTHYRDIVPHNPFTTLGRYITGIL